MAHLKIRYTALIRTEALCVFLEEKKKRNLGGTIQIVPQEWLKCRNVSGGRSGLLCNQEYSDYCLYPVAMCKVMRFAIPDVFYEITTAQCVYWSDTARFIGRI